MQEIAVSAGNENCHRLKNGIHNSNNRNVQLILKITFLEVEYSYYRYEDMYVKN